MDPRPLIAAGRNPRTRGDERGPGAWVFIGRALRLRCPECGVSPLFKPWRDTRSTFDWFAPLDGCPRCGFAYQREQGYFLLSIWALNYGLIAGGGLGLALIVDALWKPDAWVIICSVFAPMPVLSFLFARHSKALFLALDHYCDPHLRPGRNDSDRDGRDGLEPGPEAGPGVAHAEAIGVSASAADENPIAHERAEPGATEQPSGNRPPLHGSRTRSSGQPST